jgi:hypothetical protein
MAHGDAQDGKWRGNWRMGWVASTLTLPRNMVYPALLTLMRTPQLPAVDWTDSPTDSNGLVHFSKRWNLVSVRVPSSFKRAILHECVWSASHYTCFTLWKNAKYQLNRRLYGPEIWPGSSVEVENLMTLWSVRTDYISDINHAAHLVSSSTALLFLTWVRNVNLHHLVQSKWETGERQLVLKRN